MITHCVLDVRSSVYPTPQPIGAARLRSCSYIIGCGLAREWGGGFISLFIYFCPLLLLLLLLLRNPRIKAQILPRVPSRLPRGSSFVDLTLEIGIEFTFYLVSCATASSDHAYHNNCSTNLSINIRAFLRTTPKNWRPVQNLQFHLKRHSAFKVDRDDSNAMLAFLTQ